MVAHLATLASIKESISSGPGGVNVAGYLTAESGVGAAARGYVSALREAGVEVALNNFDVAVQSRKNDQTFETFATNNPYPVNLICVNADQVPAFVHKFGEDYFKDKYNIAVWWWELPDFPEQWLESFSRFDEIWVGSTFIQQSLAKISPVPVVRIPPVVTAERAGQHSRADFQLPEGEFLFLFMFDSLSSMARKNPLAVIEAFKKAFRPSESVRLVLKCINMSADKGRELESAFADSKVTLIDRYLSAAENLGLIDVCDSYVSLHRSEGLGLPLAEAMLLKKPTIATAWSGNMDFMSVANSHLVSYQLILNETANGPYQVGETWAEADVDHAASIMREVFETRGQHSSEERYRRAAIDVEAQFSARAAGDLVRCRLQSVRAFKPNLPDAGKLNSQQQDYHLDETVRRQLDIIEKGSAAPLDNSTRATASEQSKSMMRRLVMPILERTGYLGSIYSQLIRRLFIDGARSKLQIDMIDARTRKSLAEADRRIRDLEKTVEELRRQVDADKR